MSCVARPVEVLTDSPVSFMLVLVCQLASSDS